MATCIILAGGGSTRMPGDKAFMEVSGRRVIDIQLEVIRGVFDETLIVGNAERLDSLFVYSERGARVAEESVEGKGPLGGLLSGLLLSSSRENFVLACDMPFVRREGVGMVLKELKGFQVAVPETPGGLEPLHAAYTRDCAGVIERQMEGGDFKVSAFFEKVRVNYIPWRRMLEADPTGRMLLNINSPADMRKATGIDDLEPNR
jgi:molybdenum cofactor guanylyltransferase